MSSTVYTVNLTIYTGIDFSQTFVFEGLSTNSRLNLSGYQICAKMRRAEESSTYTSFTTDITDIANARVNLGMTNAVTSTLKPGKYLYDILLQDPSGDIERVVEGQVNVKRTITR
jgi:hypothetical protein